MARKTVLIALAAALCALVPAFAGDAQRGRTLYELGCGECHSESVHGRAHRVARDMEGIRAWVRRWSGQLNLGWTDGEIDDVAAYLNDTYYHFDCPAATCREVSMAHLDARR